MYMAKNYTPTKGGFVEVETPRPIVIERILQFSKNYNPKFKTQFHLKLLEN